MASQFYPQMFQYAQGLAQVDQQAGAALLAATLQAAFQGSSELMKRVLETFDIQNPDIYLPQPSGSSQALPAQTGVPAGAQAQALGGAFGPSPLAQGMNPLMSLLGIG